MLELEIVIAAVVLSCLPLMVIVLIFIFYGIEGVSKGIQSINDTLNDILEELKKK